MKLIENNKVGLFDNVVIDTESIKYQSIQQKKAKKEGEIYMIKKMKSC